MSEYAPVRTVADMATLHMAEVDHGYAFGLQGYGEPREHVSRSFWHGWRVGAMEAGTIPMDEHQQALRAEYFTRSGTTPDYSLSFYH